MKTSLILEKISLNGQAKNQQISIHLDFERKYILKKIHENQSKPD